METKGSIFWLVISLAVSSGAGYAAFVDAMRFAELADLLATIISILIGVSLAVIAVLVTPISFESDGGLTGTEERKRIKKVVDQDDEILALGQVFLFRVYFLSLFLILSFKWLTASENPICQGVLLDSFGAITAFVSSFAFFWSSRLPLLLMRVAEQRKSL